MDEIIQDDDVYVELAFTDIDDYTKVYVICPEGKQDDFIENLTSMGYEYSYKNWRD